MNGNIVLDTNIILYILGNRLDWNCLPDGNQCISVITEIELLSYPSLQESEKTNILNLLQEIDIVNFNESIKYQTIELRKKYNLKIPDAIIVSTAFYKNAMLVTNDKKLKQISEIDVNILKQNFILSKLQIEIILDIQILGLILKLWLVQ